MYENVLIWPLSLQPTINFSVIVFELCAHVVYSYYSNML